MKLSAVPVLLIVLFAYACKKDDAKIVDDPYPKIINAMHGDDGFDGFAYSDTMIYRADGRMEKVIQRDFKTGQAIATYTISYDKKGLVSAVSEMSATDQYYYQFYYGTNNKLDSIQKTSNDKYDNTTHFSYDTNNWLTHVVTATRQDTPYIYAEVNYYRDSIGYIDSVRHVLGHWLIYPTRGTVLYAYKKHFYAKSFINPIYCLIAALQKNYNLFSSGNSPSYFPDQYLHPNQVLLTDFTQQYGDLIGESVRNYPLQRVFLADGGAEEFYYNRRNRFKFIYHTD